ncbi:MAG: Lrp/AsnC ligand binding domain-containing protein [Bacteroidetes bacterium]|nr:Lrp/AsnC ligand binding domain-containing protein [Bacteroidota bacterium]MBP7398361.1 Lrp/AsnC ligand binding domain-containing protein [Chitinophagales bacterium]MBK7107684.1 Lrp/AsnC ligand binding domain-containing protein [Bacteroidota bacterium]MBK8486884.1 Lrp/AsnC ligand binding domain-containing protein [Bacteroidota bacterium]MBK8681218.1 Lrp/AsnC ligand binding domain-containing protein [Bacteroidota bacterium]
MSENLQLDKLDVKILDILMHNATIPYTEIAKMLNVSSGTIHVRMKKLENMEIIRSSNLQINPTKVGYDVTAFLGVYLEKSSMYDDVVKELQTISEVTECYYLTGDYNMFVKLLCRDTNHLKDVLHDKIQKINGIDRTETFIALEQTFIRPMKIVLNHK